MPVRPTVIAVCLALAACAQPGPPVATCTLTKVGAFPVTFVGLNPTIVIDIAGHPEHMLVDTGGGNSILMPEAYDNLPATQLTRIYGAYGTGAGGDFGIDTGILEDLEIGSVKLKDEGLIVMNFIKFRGGSAPARVDGLLGFDVLQNFDVAFDLPNRLITFYEPQHCASGETPWAGDYDTETFVPRSDRLNEPDIPVAIDGSPMVLLIDSGARSSLITQRALTAAGLTPETVGGTAFRGAGIANLSFTYRREQFTTVTIGAETFSNLWIRVGDLAATPDSPMQGLLGEDYLAHHRVFLANTARTAYLGLTIPSQD